MANFLQGISEFESRDEIVISGLRSMNLDVMLDKDAYDYFVTVGGLNGDLNWMCESIDQLSFCFGKSGILKIIEISFSDEATDHERIKETEQLLGMELPSSHQNERMVGRTLGLEYEKVTRFYRDDRLVGVSHAVPD